MSFAKVHTRTVLGLSALPVAAEVHLSQGLPALTMVGLPEGAVRESKDRVRSAILNSGYEFPNRRMTINLAPADVPKDGSRLDLPICIGLLVASGQLSEQVLGDFEFVGELSLNGELRPITGALAVALAVKNDTKRTLIVPKQNAEEVAQISDMPVLGATTLDEVCRHLLAVANGTHPNDRLAKVVKTPTTAPSYPLDLADVKGQHLARRALEVAAAGGHSLLFKGPPGAGKTLMASRLAGIFPPMSETQALEVASIYSVAGLPYVFGRRPYREVHHTISAVALVGGGSRPKAGEITLASNGVLFMDELPEFDRKTLEVLRQPLESKRIVISRANAQVAFPANFQLIAAMNPCPCGYYGDPSGRCTCTPQAIRRYQEKLSGPILDRIDLMINVPAVPIEALQTKQQGEPSSVVQQRVINAYHIAKARQGKQNADLSPSELDQIAPLGENEQKLLANAQARLNLSARSYHRIVRVARTIADLSNAKTITCAHLAESLSYRA